MSLPGIGSMGLDFFPVDRLRSRRNVKWSRHGADVIPAWIADMDLPVAEPVQEALERLSRDQDYGYPQRDGGRPDVQVARAFARWMKTRFDWDIDPDLGVACIDLVQACTALVTAFSEPGGGVILQTPAYPPMREAIGGVGRALLDNPLCVSAASGAGYVIDVDGLREHARAGAEVMLFCNPQNPTGRAFTRDELEDIARIVLESDLVVVSDEIHADLVYGRRRHIPFASLSPEIAARTVTINSATKSFNIAGLRCAVMQFGSPALMERFFRRIPRRLLGQPAISGIDATVAAWTDPRSEDWLDSVVAYLESRRDWLAGAVRAEIPSIRMHPPEATYLAWLDCAAVCGNLPASQWALDRARVACNPGETFAQGYGAHMRLNFATSPEVLGIMLDRLRKAAT